MHVRGWRPLAVGLLVAASVSGCAGSGSSGGHSRGPFAGYSAYANVHSITAAWLVPRILAGSHDGSASTWIGTQNNSGPFIQVGVTEDRTFGVGKVNAFSFHVDHYRAFWSATALHFHPHGLFRVSPGDLIVATLHHFAGRWIVAIADGNSGRDAVFSTTDDAASSFNQGEWLQEDPSFGRLHHTHHLPYPQMTVVRFTGAKLNGLPLTHWPHQRQTMMPKGGGTVLTGRARKDSFSIYGLKISGGRRFRPDLARLAQVFESRP